jgi:hypothetical protein
MRAFMNLVEDWLLLESRYSSEWMGAGGGRLGVRS